MISKKTISFILKIGIVFFSIFFLYNQFINRIEHNQFDSYSIIYIIKSNIYYMLLVFIMMFINWFIEAFKWRFLIKKLEHISFWTSIRAIFSGITVSTFTPNRIGEYGGRVFCLSEADRIQGVLITVIGSMAQLATTIFFGFLGLIFLPKYMPEIADLRIYKIIPELLWIFALSSIAVLFIICFLKINILSDILSKFSFLSKFKKYNKVFSLYSLKELLFVLALSVFRYMVFTTQFFILLYVFETNISYKDAFPLIMVMLFVISVIPTNIFPVITELSVRGSVAVFLFCLVDSSITLEIFSATFMMWGINFVIPALIGMMFIFSLKFFRT